MELDENITIIDEDIYYHEYGRIVSRSHYVMNQVWPVGTLFRNLTGTTGDKLHGAASWLNLYNTRATPPQNHVSLHNPTACANF